tara:strand:+ start:996 stop:1364 length:369 start_codon:yes stop_codon:yes gene_type:complete
MADIDIELTAGESILKLEPHPARRRSLITGELVESNPGQRQIMVDGKRIGYCGALPGMPITLIRRFSDIDREEIKAFIEREVGKVSGMGQPPMVVADAEADADYDGADAESEPDGDDTETEG